MGKHVGQCFYESKRSGSRVHETFLPIPQHVLERRYPTEAPTFGQALGQARMDAGLEIRELARLTGLHEMTIANWEHGRSRPCPRSWERVKRVMEGNGVSVTSLSGT